MRQCNTIQLIFCIALQRFTFTPRRCSCHCNAEQQCVRRTCSALFLPASFCLSACLPLDVYMLFLFRGIVQLKGWYLCHHGYAFSPPQSVYISPHYIPQSLPLSWASA